MIKLYFRKIGNASAHSDKFIREILEDILEEDGESLVICKNEFGKPYLKDYLNIHFNISHTKGAIICAISDKPVGVDIERIRKANKQVVKKCFTVDEQNYIFSNEKSIDERFTRIWTMKEAYVKWIGQGMEIPFNSFDVLRNDNYLIWIFKKDCYMISVCQERFIVNGTSEIKIFEI